MGVGMSSDEQLRPLVWIEAYGNDCQASFVAEAAVKQRTPAVRRFASPDEARRWVMQEADAVRAPVEWIPQESVRGGLVAGWQTKPPSTLN